MNKSNKASIVVSQIIEKIEKIVGIVWAALFLLTAVIMIFEAQPKAGDVIVMLIIAALGVLLFLAGRKRGLMRLEFRKYVTQLSRDPSGSIDNLASATGTSVDVVKKNLNYMIKKNFFVDAFINEQDNLLVLPSTAQREQGQQNWQNGAASTSAQTELVVLTCPSCGGINKIPKGTVADCDFCGSPLQG